MISFLFAYIFFPLLLLILTPLQHKNIESEAFVVGVRKNTINVLLPKFGLEGPVLFADADGTKPQLDYDPDTPSLTVKIGPSVSS